MQCDEETGRGRRTGADKSVTTLGGWTKRRVESVKRKKARRRTGFSTVRYGGKSRTRTRGGFGEKGTQGWRIGIGTGSWKKNPLVSPEVGVGKHRSWSMPVEEFRNHVATDGSLVGVSGRWSACVWSLVQLDHDEEMGSKHGMYGVLDTKLEVQRTIKRAELTAFLCLLRRIIGPDTEHIDNKGIIDGLWRGAMKCIGSKSEGRRLVDFDLREARRSHQQGVLLEVEHAKAHQLQQRKQTMTSFELFLSRKATKWRMRLQNLVQCWKEEKRSTSGPARSSREERKFTKQNTTSVNTRDSAKRKVVKLLMSWTMLGAGFEKGLQSGVRGRESTITDIMRRISVQKQENSRICDVQHKDNSRVRAQTC